VFLDPEHRTVRFLRPGVEIKLGSIGKGYALDRMVEWLADSGKVSSALLHGGSSSLYALGDAQPGAIGWKVRVRHPWRPGKHLIELRLRDRAMATSAATFQHFVHKGRRFGHILDPRDGLPAAGVASATVLAPTGALADALSTAFYVGGEELARSYCESHGDIAVVMLTEGKREPTVLNLPSSDYTFF
ncbi:MAG: FAD:protein FMN transferase, partial [Gemmataceae bacterium]